MNEIDITDQSKRRSKKHSLTSNSLSETHGGKVTCVTCQKKKVTNWRWLSIRRAETLPELQHIIHHLK